jgi:hypothetical protein
MPLFQDLGSSVQKRFLCDQEAQASLWDGCLQVGLSKSSKMGCQEYNSSTILAEKLYFTTNHCFPCLTWNARPEHMELIKADFQDVEFKSLWQCHWFLVAFCFVLKPMLVANWDAYLNSCTAEPHLLASQSHMRRSQNGTIQLEALHQGCHCTAPSNTPTAKIPTDELFHVAAGN